MCIITITLSFTDRHFKAKVKENLRKSLINENIQVLTCPPESFPPCQQSYTVKKLRCMHQKHILAS